MSVGWSDVQFVSLTDLVIRGDVRDDSAETIFQSCMQEATISSSGMGRDVHCMTFSIQHFLWWLKHISDKQNFAYSAGFWQWKDGRKIFTEKFESLDEFKLISREQWDRMCIDKELESPNFLPCVHCTCYIFNWFWPLSSWRYCSEISLQTASLTFSEWRIFLINCHGRNWLFLLVLARTLLTKKCMIFLYCVLPWVTCMVDWVLKTSDLYLSGLCLCGLVDWVSKISDLYLSGLCLF